MIVEFGVSSAHVELDNLIGHVSQTFTLIWLAHMIKWWLWKYCIVYFWWSESTRRAIRGQTITFSQIQTWNLPLSFQPACTHPFTSFLNFVDLDCWTYQPPSSRLLPVTALFHCSTSLKWWIPLEFMRKFPKCLEKFAKVVSTMLKSEENTQRIRKACETFVGFIHVVQ